MKKDSFDAYIGRRNDRAKLQASIWANPFKIGAPHPVSAHPIDRDDAVGLYKEWIARGEGRPLLRRLGELEDATLGCWCAPKGGVGAHDPPVCHGQVLLLLMEHRARIIERGKGSKD